MNELLFFETLYVDRQRISGQTTNFFTEESDNSKSIRDYTEDEITDWLLDNEVRRKFFLEKLFPNPTEIKDLRRLKKPFTPDRGKPGDIDIVLYDPQRINQATAIECKRVKIEALSEDESRINGAQNIAEGVIQANKYLDIGFSKVYLTIYMLHDGRKLNTPSTLHRIGKGENVDRLFNIPWNEGLKNEVGLIFFEIYQNTDKIIDTKYGLGICHDKRAVEREQLTLTTENLKKEELRR